MNLFDKATLDSVLVVGPGVKPAHGTVGQIGYRGASIPAGEEIIVPDACRFFSLRSRPDFCGWFAVMKHGGPDLIVSTWNAETGAIVGDRRIASDAGSPVPVFIPWPTEIGNAGSAIDVVLRAEGGEGEVFVAAHRMMRRDDLFAAAKGRGVEIGPGPRPQILSDEETAVIYVEQMTPEAIDVAYRKTGLGVEWSHLWDAYRIGNASDIPAEPGSLDFIFGSHVFEHLANPLGHLARWRSLLRPGGRILCVVPELTGARDYFQCPTGISEWLAEMHDESWVPTINQYARYYRVKDDDPRAIDARDRGRSIHVHFYTNSNVVDLLDYACANLGFSHYNLEWTRNHKDFYFMLARD